MTAVIDSSALVDLLTGQVGAAVADLLARDGLQAPVILDAEVANALAGMERGGMLGKSEAALAVGDLLDVPIDRAPLAPLLPGAWALRHNLSLYDAFYVALARELGCALITTDARLGKAPRLGVELIRPA